MRKRLSDEILKLSGQFKSLKDIQSESLVVFDPVSFDYMELIGSGAFAKVRKCI